jgi:hypothetical protein
MPNLPAPLRRALVLGFAALALGLTLAASAEAKAPKDRIVVSGVVNVPRGQTVSDVVIADGPVNILGRVSGNVVSAHGAVRIGGRVHGDVVAVKQDAIVLGPKARIGGDLLYRGAKPNVPPGAVAGDVKKLNVDKIGTEASFATAAAIWIAASVSTLILGLLLLWIAPRAADAAFEVARTGVGPAIGWGFGLLIGLPILAVIALITIVGIPLGIGLLLVLIPLYAIGYTTGAWLLGRRLVSPPRGRALSFLAGWAVLRLLALIPVLGGLVWLAATVFGLGVLVVAAWRAREPREPTAAPAPA